MELLIVFAVLGGLILFAVGGEIRAAHLKKKGRAVARSIEAKPELAHEEKQPPIEMLSIKERLQRLGFLFHDYANPDSTLHGRVRPSGSSIAPVLFMTSYLRTTPSQEHLGDAWCACHCRLHIVYGSGTSPIKEVVGVYCLTCGRGYLGSSNGKQYPSTAERESNWKIWGNLLTLLPYWENEERNSNPPQQGKPHLHIVKR